MIDWLLQTMADLPALPAEAWLSLPERERLAALRVEKKRREWLLGRWTAKRLVQAALLREGRGQVELADLSITPAADGAPELQIGRGSVWAGGALTISISHSGGRAFCALGPEGAAVGADIETVCPRAPSFAGDFFGAGELALVAGASAARRDRLVTAIWSAKEAALKALRLGLTVDTRLVECLVPDIEAGVAGWAPLTATCHPSLGAPPAGLRCWWRSHEETVLTLAAAPASVGAGPHPSYLMLNPAE
jgi:4'-phosphopantetheinyl transferase